MRSQTKANLVCVAPLRRWVWLCQHGRICHVQSESLPTGFFLFFTTTMTIFSRPIRRTVVSLSIAVTSLMCSNFSSAANFCPTIYNKGNLPLKFMPGFAHVDRYADGDGLTISSFLNAGRNPNPGPPFVFFERDLVARIPALSTLSASTFDPLKQVQVLSDISTPTAPKTVWPNEAERLPSGMLPFDGLIVPQGFISAAKPGRLSIINLSATTKTEYLVHQSTQSAGSPQDPANSPRAYHKVLFLDMDGDGLKDIVTVRSGFRVGATTYPPYGELVYFKNPGSALKADVAWKETVLWGGSIAGFLGPDITLAAADFDKDGNLEIVATHFFSNAGAGGPPTAGKIVLYGAPLGGKWRDVNLATGRVPRIKEISTDQGFPFGLQIIDLNRDGKLDVLASNHAPDNCTPQTSSVVPGRVYALQMPKDGKIFSSPWITHILQDNIRPNPSLPGATGGGRLAPGKAQAFFTHRSLESVNKPQIVVGGDEAGKVWLLRAQSNSDVNNWNYDVGLVFDINQTYGASTTQTPIASGPAVGRTKSTIGGIALRYNSSGYTEMYVPVYEAQDIRMFSWQYLGSQNAVPCLQTAVLACPVVK